MEKMIGRDTRRPRRKNKTQTLRSRSRANGLLIPANNWDVSKMGGMSEEIDTAGGGEGRERRECLRARDSSWPWEQYRCLHAPAPAPSQAAVCSTSPGPSISVAFAALLLELSFVSVQPTQMKTQLFVLVAAAAAFIARAVWGTKRPAGRSPPKIHSRGDLRAVETSRPVQASQALRRLSITRPTS